MSSLALVRTGPVSGEQDAPPVGVTERIPGTTLLATLLDVSVNDALTVSPVTTSEREAPSALNRPWGLRPGSKTSAPPCPVLAVNGARVVHLFVAISYRHRAAVLPWNA